MSSKKKQQTRIVGAILPDGRINVSLLEREIVNELADDARFSAEDGMKKRAVHMSEYAFVCLCVCLFV